jgi:hypothetical protein
MSVCVLVLTNKSRTLEDEGAQQKQLIIEVWAEARGSVVLRARSAAAAKAGPIST